MAMKKFALLSIVAVVTLMAGCNRNPAWDGSRIVDKADRFAAETCTCLYKMAGQEPGWNRDAIMREIKSLRKAGSRSLQSAVLQSDNPEIQKAIAVEEDFSLKMDECECMKPVQDGLLDQGVSFDEMMTSLNTHCLLGAFYN
jgi:hypothetical protein